jgi:hypothetical protein
MTASDSAAQTINSQSPTRHHVHSPYSLTPGLRNLGSTTGEQGVHQRITDDSTMARMAVDRMLEWFCRKEPASAGFLLPAQNAGLQAPTQFVDAFPAEAGPTKKRCCSPALFLLKDISERIRTHLRLSIREPSLRRSLLISDQV